MIGLPPAPEKLSSKIGVFHFSAKQIFNGEVLYLYLYLLMHHTSRH